MPDVWIIFCFAPLPWSVFEWIILNLCTFIICLFGAYFIYLIWQKLEYSIDVWVKCICTTIAIFFMCSTVILSVHITSSFYCIYDFQTWLDQGLAALFFDQLGVSLLYLLFVIRLTYPFQGTSLQNSKVLSYIFIIGFILMLVFGSLVMLIFKAFPPTQWHLAFDAMISFQATNLLFTVILLCVFVKKMLLLQDAVILKKVTRIIICASTGLLSSQLPSIVSFIRSIRCDNEILFVSHVMLLAVDQLINLFSIYLQFPVGTKMYNKICGKLEKLCSKHVIDISNLKAEAEISSHPKIESKPTSNSVTSNCTSPKSISTPDFIENTKSEHTIKSTITISSSPQITKEVTI